MFYPDQDRQKWTWICILYDNTSTTQSKYSISFTYFK